jgi:Ca2+-binding EF-hand superfamily protein
MSINEEKLRQYFRLKDLDRSGYLDRYEIRFLLTEITRNHHLPPPNQYDIDRFIQKYDANGDKKISEEEFVDGFFGFYPNQRNLFDNDKKQKLIQIFRQLDRDGNNYVSFNELKKAIVEIGYRFNISFSQAKLQGFFRYYDINGDGRISLEEFLELSL